jgi:drug/metabolite transporter (DMT)-like permease
MEHRAITLTSMALLFLTVMLAVYAQLVWKARSLAHAALPLDRKLDYILTMFRDPWIWSGLASMAVGTVGWMLVLRRLELSVAYPATALVFVLVPLGAHLLFGETMSPARIAGLSLIVAGIIVVARTA